jgi:hypothetical protein
MSFGRIYILSIIFFILASAAEAENRDLVIQKTLDCVDSHPQKDGISWNDVCVVPQSYQEEHLAAVNQEMDNVEHAPPAVIPNVQAVTPAKSPAKPLWTYEFGPEISYIKYHEIGVMKETGNMYGINGSISLHPPEDNDIVSVVRLEGNFSYGKIKYDGATQDLFTGVVTPESFNGISDYLTELRFLAGKDFDLNQELSLTPYFGFGYRQLFDASYANKPFGYNRRIQYFYLPMGTDIALKLIDGWSLMVNMEYDFFLRGFVTSGLKEIGLANVNTRNTQTAGFGARGSVKLTKDCNTYNFFMQPFLRYWNIHTSRETFAQGLDTDNDGDPGDTTENDDGFFVVEPHNTSLELGVKMGIEF